MSRTTLRIFVATILALLALVATAALGVWQYTRAYRADVEKQILNSKQININSVSSLGEYVPENYYGQKVTVEGELICEGIFKNEIPSEGIDWFVSAIQLDDNSLIAIASVENLCKSNAISASWVGRIQPAQDFTQLSATYTPPPVAVINTDDLVIRWKSNVRDGYVLITKDIPQNLIVLPPVGIDIRNLFYAWQWWLFAAFAVFIYIRFVRDELTSKRTQ